MSTLREIEKATAELSADEQRELLRFLLRIIPVDEAALPEPRLFSPEQLKAWMDEDEEDEEDLRKFRAGSQALSGCERGAGHVRSRGGSIARRL